MKIRNLLLLIVIVIQFPTIALGQTKEELIANNKMFNESCQYARTGDYDAAISILKNLIHKESDKTRIAMYYDNMGYCQGKQEHFEEALKSFGLAIDTAPDFVMSYQSRGALFVKLKNNANALKDYADGLKIDSTNAQILLGRSLIYRDNGELKLAEKDLELLVKYHPEDFLGRTSLGFIYKKQGKLSEALQVFDDLIKDRPNDAVSYNNRAEIQIILEKLDDALKSVNDAISLKPNFGYAHFIKAKILIKMNQTEEACKSMNLALKSDYSSKELTTMMKTNCH